ncbi:E3 ubiquitin-protein ligase RNF34-like [Metopolophium dirhodum]|uniref:E3 ubiquitin-protein ligase RNF34-like n=1 Tax=Metopolophium dirhodum TaxID=44670 RepID=UPI002990596D|nr:E3 ubiquitin-protein ligase RNF34-like [Metopolophium dirhodum]
MNVKKKILPVICLMSAYVHWIKPRLLSASASKGGKSLLLHLCGRSRFLIPMIVFTAFWLFDAQMQIEASVSLTLRRNVQITIGTAEEEPEVDVDDDDEEEEDDDDDADDDDDLYTIDSYSDISSTSDVSMLGLEDVHIALQEFINSDGAGRRFSIRHSLHRDHHEQ